MQHTDTKSMSDMISHMTKQNKGAKLEKKKYLYVDSNLMNVTLNFKMKFYHSSNSI